MYAIHFSWYLLNLPIVNVIIELEEREIPRQSCIKKFDTKLHKTIKEKQNMIV